jgi:16S rRNA (uracil1498-N3)-methyltransferase
MSERFFVPSPIAGNQTRLEGPEAQHLTKVMRASVGDEITLFDGSGREYLGRVAAISRQFVELEVIQQREVDRELRSAVTLAVALPKGDRQQWLVEKLTELGVTRLIPIVCQRSVAQPSESALARIERWVIEASKQCGRNRLMEIGAPQSWKELAIAATGNRYIAHTADTNTPSFVAEQPLLAAVGPEGGWAPDEVAIALEHGWQPLSLGPRILRVETAAIAIAALAASPLTAAS